jgi:hypothetical protein
MPEWTMVMVELVGGPLDGDETEVVAGSAEISLPVSGTDLDVHGLAATYRADGDWSQRPRFHYVAPPSR